MYKLKMFIPFMAAYLLLLLFSCSDDTVSPITTGVIKGQVLDAVNNQKLKESSITTSPATSAILTDDNGNFMFRALDEGKYTISATKSGYKKGIVSVNVIAGDTAQAVLQLDREENTNTVPDKPANPEPAVGASGQPISLLLKWSASDPNPNDTLMFDVYLYPANGQPEVVLADSYIDSVEVSGLLYATTYYWQVVVKDNNGGVTNGDVWRFTTESFPDNPLVFASNRQGTYDIYSADFDTLDYHVVQLNSDQSRDWWPRLNPDRSKIAFISDRTVEPQIYTMNRDGTGILRVTDVPVTGYHNYGIGFGWSPDGTRFLYSHYEKLYRIDANGTNLTQIAIAPAGRNFREVAYSPLGNKIAALAIGSWFYDSEIYLMDADGGNMTLLVDNWPGAIESPSFSPDGNWVVFSHDISGYEVSSGRQLNTHVFLMKTDGSDTVDVSANKPAGTNDTMPRYSPDGTKIIFCNTSNDGSHPQEIWMMDLNGENRTRIISNGTMPDWQ